ncbi:YjbQ family protein [candidate division KSB1 bacterium]|nr:YjbQ family protein [candidate division KSB1 bacterium]
MSVITEFIPVATRGYTDIIDITQNVSDVIKNSSLKNGIATIFVSGSTAGITTIEYESGLLEDLPQAFEKFAPMNIQYHHDRTWSDGNGYAHVRAALLGASFTVPFKDNKMILGTWQQIVLIDFDNRPRKRELVVQIIGE